MSEMMKLKRARGRDKENKGGKFRKKRAQHVSSCVCVYDIIYMCVFCAHICLCECVYACDK